MKKAPVKVLGSDIKVILGIKIPPDLSQAVKLSFEILCKFNF
jgi:hypothetical protein